MALLNESIAKLKSNIDHYVNKSNQDKKISFGSEDIHFTDQMIDDDFDSLDVNNAVYMYKGDDVSGKKDLPVQKDYKLRHLFSLVFASSQS